MGTRRHRPLPSTLALPVGLALAACGGGGDRKVDYALVEVGDAGYAGYASDTSGFGRVAYAYRIGRYAVTLGQYAAFLNAVAATDPYALYDPRMTSDLNSAGITRTGAPGGYRYAVMDNHGSSAKRPVTYVTWLDAARFASWMANGQPSGAQDAATTENARAP